MIDVLIAGVAIDVIDIQEYSHGRHERRCCAIYAIPAGRISSDWHGVRRLIVVDRWRTVASGQTTVSRHLYLSSRSDATSLEFLNWIRAHWQIENSLHWVKDVIQNEDRCGIGGSAAVTLSTLKTWALSLFRSKGFNSIKYATIRFANKINELYTLTST